MREILNILQEVFSVKKDEKRVVFTLLGVKLKFKRSFSYRTQQALLELKEENVRIKDELMVIHSYLFDKIIEKHIDNIEKISYQDFVNNIFNNENVLLATWIEKPIEQMKNYPVLFSNEKSFISSGIKSKDYRSIFWGTHFKLKDNVEMLKDITLKQNDYAIAEMGFLHRIHNTKYNKDGVSYVFDDIAPYFDARYPNRLEQMLNDTTLVITDEQKERARRCIDRIVETHLTKYNHQPIFEPKIGREGVKKVLVVDQSYGDMSILKGLANDATFKNMLECAIKENPDADIIIKTHPDNITKLARGIKSGYYSDIKPHDNVYTMTEPINPISMIKYVDKVYVCSSQFGFESLMCGKEVHTFGMPFYANWGLTIDAQKCERRKNTRSLEEVFYIAYIMYSYYVNPDKKSRCEIEEAMDYLLNLRDEYFDSLGRRNK